MGQLFDWADCVRGSLGSLLLEKQEEQVEEDVVVGLAQCISQLGILCEYRWNWQTRVVVGGLVAWLRAAIRLCSYEFHMLKPQTYVRAQLEILAHVN